MLFSLMQAGLAGLTLLAMLLGFKIIQNCYLSPLKSIPGPFFAKITDQWLVFIDLAGDRTRTINELHNRYGPVVRIAPNQISFSNIETVKELYSAQTVYKKAPVYHNFSLPPLGIFSLTDKAAHGQRRRLLSHAFSQNVLYETEPTIDVMIEKLLGRIREDLGLPLNMLELFRRLSLDIVGELFLAQSFGALDQEEAPQFLTDIDRMFILLGVKENFPFMFWLLPKIPVSSIKFFVKSLDRQVDYGRKAYFRYINQKDRKSERKNLLTKIVDQNPEAGTRPLTDEEAYMEVANLVFAGTDTTSTTLTYLFWELAKHPEWQTKVSEELKTKLVVTKNGNATNVPSYAKILDLPILEAVINESLRLHPAAPASLQRSTPAEGRTVGGYFIPGETVISMQCYTTHRDRSAFPNPETFDPDRWLSSPPTEEMKELFMPFSKGPRACLGKNLAVMELKLVTAAIMLQGWKISVDKGTTEDSMIMKDHFLAVPKGGRCDLIFEKA